MLQEKDIKDVVREQLEGMTGDITKALREDGSLDLDSLHVVQFVIRLEKAFNISIPDQYLNPESFRTLDEVVRLIQDIMNRPE